MIASIAFQAGMDQKISIHAFKLSCNSSSTYLDCKIDDRLFGQYPVGKICILWSYIDEMWWRMMMLGIMMMTMMHQGNNRPNSKYVCYLLIVFILDILSLSTINKKELHFRSHTHLRWSFVCIHSIVDYESAQWMVAGDSPWWLNLSYV